MFKWTDAAGQLHYSQTPPLNQQTQRFDEVTVEKKGKTADPACCMTVRTIANQMILAQTKGATITDLYAFFQHPELGDLQEITNYVSHKYQIGIEPSQISQMTYDTCLNAGFNLCSGQEKVEPFGRSSGSGFYINSDGFLLTNSHVVKACESIRIIPGDENADLITADENIDLAILKTKSTSNYARFRASDANLGEEIIVAGFPYRGELSSGINVTTGTVSALAGPKDDERLIQISAPVQPGNSGGPLLDKNGNVTGVVVSKLDSLYFAQKYRDIPQNINFAIRATFARSFLDEHHITFETDSHYEETGTMSVSRQAASFTVVVECIREDNFL